MIFLVHAKIVALYKIFVFSLIFTAPHSLQSISSMKSTSTSLSGVRKILLISVCSHSSSFFMKHYAIRSHSNRDLAMRKQNLNKT